MYAMKKILLPAVALFMGSGSDGYAEGPDHRDTLHVDYLTGIFKGDDKRDF